MDEATRAVFERLSVLQTDLYRQQGLVASALVRGDAAALVDLHTALMRSEATITAMLLLAAPWAGPAS